MTGARRRTARRRRGAAALLALLALGPSGARAAEADLVIEHARIVSPPLPVREDASLAIEGGRIARIASAALALPAKRRIDARGRALIPGLVDTHVHLQVEGVADEAAYRAWVATGGRAKLEDYARHGFTTILSAGDYWPGVLALRELARRPGVAAPRLLLSGPMLSPPGGHGAADYPSCNAVPYCATRGWYREVGDPEQARAIVAELARAGVDGVKIAHDGSPVAYPTDHPMGHFAPGVLAALIEAAHARGLPVRVHAYPVANALEAVGLGADALLHGPGLLRVGGSDARLGELVALLARKGVPVSTTLGVQGVIEDPWGVRRDAAYGTTEAVAFIETSGSARASLADARAFAREGVVLAFGTDLFGLKRPGDAIALELRELSEAGFTNAEILAMATAGAARLLGRSRELGSIEEGKLADLALVSADPLRSLAFVDRVDLVVREGTVVYDAETAAP